MRYASQAEILPAWVANVDGKDGGLLLLKRHGGHSAEIYWMGVHNGRTALAAALAEMIVAQEISEPQAMAMAHGYLHDNAANLYK